MTGQMTSPTRPRAEPRIPTLPTEGMKLHIGGKVRVPGWTVLNVNPGSHVDIIGNCTDLGMIESDSCAMVYASHVFEHLGYDKDLPQTLSECYRVLKSGGRLLISVPDLDALCRLFLDPKSTPEDRHCIMQVMYGGRSDAYDVHLSGFSIDILGGYLRAAGFAGGYRVDNFGLFQDSSILSYNGVPISLNLVSIKA